VPRHSETRELKFSCDQMYAVVADVERYPEFLPWCTGLTVKSRDREGSAEVLIAEMTVVYHGMRERYTSRVRLDPVAYTITAQHVEGPFHHLDNLWRFEPWQRGCRIHFTIDFAFKNWMLSALSGIAFDAAAYRMTNAFVRRAKDLYGKSKQTLQ
jgi:coenzyme Q-binding protein COQ10